MKHQLGNRPAVYPFLDLQVESQAQLKFFPVFLINFQLLNPLEGRRPTPAF
ncbi:hypothetical protein ES703_63399 [subsurface metagenome]